MMERKRLLTLLLCGSLMLAGSLPMAGCSRTGGTGGNTAGQTTSSSMEEPQNGSNSQNKQGDNASKDNGSSESQGRQSDNESSAEPSPTPMTVTLSSVQKDYNDAQRTVSILGLQEYKKLKSDAYTDKPAKGKVFLVLFLEIYNKSMEKEYFNVNYLTAGVDGKEIENTFLANDPEGYTTIFTNIEAGETAKGFIVWEVPKDWKKMEVDYQGWRDSDGISLTCNLTKKDLKKPEKYEL